MKCTNITGYIHCGKKEEQYAEYCQFKQGLEIYTGGRGAAGGVPVALEADRSAAHMECGGRP